MGLVNCIPHADWPTGPAVERPFVADTLDGATPIRLAVSLPRDGRCRISASAPNRTTAVEARGADDVQAWLLAARLLAPLTRQRLPVGGAARVSRANVVAAVVAGPTFPADQIRLGPPRPLPDGSDWRCRCRVGPDRTRGYGVGPLSAFVNAAGAVACRLVQHPALESAGGAWDGGYRAATELLWAPRRQRPAASSADLTFVSDASLTELGERVPIRLGLGRPEPDPVGAGFRCAVSIPVRSAGPIWAHGTTTLHALGAAVGWLALLFGDPGPIVRWEPGYDRTWEFDTPPPAFEPMADAVVRRLRIEIGTPEVHPGDPRRARVPLRLGPKRVWAVGAGPVGALVSALDRVEGALARRRP